jgi:DNA-binding transcriptional ArsR family regulator
MGRRPKSPVVDPELARFIAVAEPSRWAMVRLLRTRARSVQEVAREVGLSMPVTSRHLQQLRATGIVTAERQGKNLYCRLSTPDTVGGRWLARAFGETMATPTPRSSAPRARPSKRPAAPPPPPQVPRRDLDDYLL